MVFNHISTVTRVIQMTTDDKELALREFLLDIDCLEGLQPWSGKFNLFDVLKASRNEIRHSNVLAWLLNPNENHGLGDAYIRKLIQNLALNEKHHKNVFNLLLLDFYSFSVYREWKNIDILLVSKDEKLVIAIENKVGSNEHDNQLFRYKEILNREFSEYQKILIYLTPDGDRPSDNDWEILTYENIVENLEDIRDKIELLPDVSLMINNYIDTIRRDIVNDTQLIEICNKIYNKHKKALDLIYEYRIDNKKYVEEIRKTLKEFSEKGKIIYLGDGSDTYIPFYTKEMTEFLPNLTNSNGSWNDEHVYRFWLSPGEKLKVVFELGGNNVPDDTMNNMQKLINIAKQDDKRKEKFKYKRLQSYRYELDSDDSSECENISDIVKEAINNILNWEKEILQAVKN